MTVALHTLDLDALLVELEEVLVRQSLRYGDFTLASGARSADHQHLDGTDRTRHRTVGGGGWTGPPAGR